MTEILEPRAVAVSRASAGEVSWRLGQGCVEHRELLGEVLSHLAAVLALHLTKPGDLRLKGSLLLAQPGQCRGALAVELGGLLLLGAGQLGRDLVRLVARGSKIASALARAAVTSDSASACASVTRRSAVTPASSSIRAAALVGVSLMSGSKLGMFPPRGWFSASRDDKVRPPDTCPCHLDGCGLGVVCDYGCRTA